MAGKYFSRMEIINYNGTLTRNVMTRVQLLNSVRNITNAFYPYTIKDGERPDTIAYDYYGDSYYDWLVYIVNNIMDPYYQWPLVQLEFDEYIAKKYGSVEGAMETVLFYRNDWADDDSVLSPAAYESLPNVLKKYWSANADQDDTVLNYTRTPEDWTVNTNKIVSLKFTVAPTLVDGDKYTQGDASGFVKFVNGTVVVLQHIVGTFVVNADITSVATIFDAFDPDEIIYWTAVDAYTRETELNNQKKQIQLLDKKYLEIVDNELQTLLSGE
jgi:hypothetical protein